VLALCSFTCLCHRNKWLTFALDKVKLKYLRTSQISQIPYLSRPNEYILEVTESTSKIAALNSSLQKMVGLVGSAGNILLLFPT
jgi:hypothetical protein